MILLGTTLTIAFFHTLAGPDHYLPFVVIARARNWSVSRTLWFTVLCGLGHVGSSVILGIAGIALGIAVSSIELWEGQRGSIVSLLLLVFGFVYMVWGIFRAVKNKPHTHIHIHSGGKEHTHEHVHETEHVHPHPHSAGSERKKTNITPWILFAIFIFGPCEPLIPLLMYPAAAHNVGLLVAVTLLFAVVTIGTMLVMVWLGYRGAGLLSSHILERWGHAIAGLTILLCGTGIVFFGL